MGKILTTQLHIMVLRKDFLVALSVLLGLTLYSYLSNIVACMNSGSVAYSWHFLYAGNTNSNIWPIFSVVYPFIIVVPFGFSYIQDKKSGLLAQYIHRAGKKHYYHAKILASFVGSFSVIAIPFAINLIMCYSTFPHNYYSPVPYDQLLTGEQVFRETVFAAKPFANLFVHNLLSYNLLYLVFLSLFSGLLGMFATAFSFLVHRMRILLFVPLFAIFQIGVYFDGVILEEKSLSYFNTNLLDYVGTDAYFGQSIIFIGSLVSAMILFIVIMCNRVTQREDVL